MTSTKDSQKNIISEEEKFFLLGLARNTIKEYLTSKKKLSLDKKLIPKELTTKYGCFVTISIDGNLRGCIGNIEPTKPLYQSVIDNAISSAFQDPRFPELDSSELDLIHIEISILTIPEKVKYSSFQDLKNKLDPLVHGVILDKGFHSSTFLPQVWEQLSDKDEFLKQLCFKGGMNPSSFDDSSIKVSTYKAIVIEE
jgi:AmmeMemoRadiSam system protein A